MNSCRRLCLRALSRRHFSSIWLVPRSAKRDLQHSEIDREVLDGQSIQVKDVCADSRFEYPAEAKREGIVSAVFVPLIARGEPIGVLRTYTAEKRAFAPDELGLLRALADLGALAITNARLYAICQRDQQMTTEALWSFHLPDEWLANE